MKNARQSVASSELSVGLESLEGRVLLTYGYWPRFLALDQVFQKQPFLTGGGNNVAVIDQGIDYFHPALGGNQAKGVKSPRVVNIWDYRDNDNNPFPSESEAVNPSTAHGTGVAGILASYPFDYNGYHYQGVLSNSLIFNLRINRLDDQNSVKQALQWVLANHTKYNITAVNLAPIVLSSQVFPAYGPELQALYNAGIFVASPVANIWNINHKAIGYPSKSPYVFGIGGIMQGGAMDYRSERGPGLDLLGPSDRITLPYYYPSKNAHIITDFGQGNSWASPYVVGTAVLMQQIDPTLRPPDIMQIMQKSGVPTVDPDKTGTYSRLNIENAILTTYQVRDDIYSRGAGNHSLQRAAAIPFSGAGAAIPNLKLLIGAPDWYSFTVGAKSNYTIRLGYGVAGQRATATLYDPAGKVLSGIGWRGLTWSFGPGKYYVQVSNAASLVGTYSLNIVPAGVTTSRRARLAAEAAARAAVAAPAVATPAVSAPSAGAQTLSWLKSAGSDPKSEANLLGS